ncbi:hypothetical protein A2U01_0115682, partial [Trifolium medium]|nr:hypothetical protein [Trifolium medium]
MTTVGNFHLASTGEESANSSLTLATASTSGTCT